VQLLRLDVAALAMAAVCLGLRERAPRSRGVVEDDAKRMTVPGAHPAHAMPQNHSVYPPRSLYRTIVHGQYDCVALAKLNDFGTRLHARTLLRDHELTTGEVAPGVRQKDRDLEWENVLTVKILVQTVVIVDAVPKQQRGGTKLTGRMTPLDEC